MEALTSFGEWVRRRRKALDYTQQQLADRVGCSLAALQKIERDERRPSRQLAALLADQLQIAADQRDQFIKVARGERMTETLPSTLEPASSPQTISSSSISRPPLPIPATLLIGRENELETISRLLADPACRLVTLTGPGGIGKTRLALQAAHNANKDGSASLVPLVGVTSGLNINTALATAIGFTFYGNTDPAAQLIAYLRNQNLLLVFDNFEHLLADTDAIQWIRSIAENTPHVKMLITSREPLNLAGEWVLDVQGLPIPAETSSINLNSAALLFTQRARQANVNFTLTEADHPSVTRICQMVQGMPLGLELAASWARLLTCSEIAAEIERGLDFLTAQGRDLPERHRSLRAVFDQSWKLLTPEEQTMLARLTVFRGGFTREAAEKVTGINLPLLSALVTKSMLRRVENGRFDLHELVRQYAAEQLTDSESVHAAHAETFLALWRDYDSILPTAEHMHARRVLTADLDNFRVAWDWSITHEKFAWISDALHAVFGFDEISGTYSELHTQMEGVVYIASEKHPSLYGRALTYQAWAEVRQGRIPNALALFDEALATLSPLNDSALLFEPVFFKGVAYLIGGDWAATQQWLTEARQHADASGNPRFVAQVAVNQSGVLAMLNSDEESFANLQSALNLLSDQGLMRARLNALNTYTVPVALKLGRLPELYQPLKESLAIYEQVGDRWIVAATSSNLGNVLAAMGDMDSARSYVARSLLLFKELGSQADIAFTHLRYGRVELVAGDSAQAEHHFREAIRVGQNAQIHMAVAEAATDLAKLWSRTDETSAHALALCLYLIQQPTTRPDLRTAAETLKTQLEVRLTPEQIQSAQVKVGKAWDVLVNIATVLGD